VNSEFLHRVEVSWPNVLSSILKQCQERGPQGVVVFDLDSTVFDNRPRQAKIVREFGLAAKHAALQKCQPFHFTDGWNLNAACVSAGLAPHTADALYAELKSFWAKRFFSSAYCEEDIEIVGAPRFVQACAQAGAKVVYCTGRQESMRPGTERCLRKCGLPAPTVDGGVLLLMKPTLEESDDAYKRMAHARIASEGHLIAAFDNEPTHINDYAERFPNCTAVHLATDHSGRTSVLHPRTVSIPHFAW
jgi:hypothetical protein